MNKGSKGIFNQLSEPFVRRARQGRHGQCHFQDRHSASYRQCSQHRLRVMRSSGTGSLLFSLLQQAREGCLSQLLRRRRAETMRFWQGQRTSRVWLSRNSLGIQGCILRVLRRWQAGAWQITINAGRLLSFALFA